MKHILSFILLASLSLVVTACSGTPTVGAATPTVVAAPVKDSSTIKAEGKLEPVQFVKLSFASGGEVTEVLVKEGDVIKTGDVLARVKSDLQQAAVTRAEAAVAAAKAAEAKYLEQLPQQIAAAEADMQAAQAAITGAAARRNDPAARAGAEAALYQAKLKQQGAEDAYKQILDKGLLGPTEEQARLAVETAKRETEAAQLRLNQLKAGSASYAAQGAEIAAAQARLDAAQARLDQLKAEANGQPNPTYAAAIQQAEAGLEAAKTAVADTELRAPLAGTIAKLEVKVGETVGPSMPIVTVADLSSWQIVTDDLTELKVPNIAEGQPVIVTFDALPELELQGAVDAIGTMFQTNSGDIVYPVKVKLIEVDPRLRWGMTAVLEFTQ